MDRVIQKRIFGHMRPRRPRSVCASAQSDQGLRCPLIESLDTIKWINGEQVPGRDFALAWYETKSVRFFACSMTHFRLAGPDKIAALLWLSLFFITKTCLYNFDPIKPHFYIVKLGFTGVYIIFSYFCSKHWLWVLVRTARRGGSNEDPHSMFWAEIWKISEFFISIFSFLVIKFSVYLKIIIIIIIIDFIYRG